MNTNTYEVVIGLEVHVQLKTKTKIFCGCINEFGSKENTNICPVCLGLPGSLPVLNDQVLKSALKVALALDCSARNYTKFDRKHYYYPDLPKNFQISQYDMPFSEHGFLEIDCNGQVKRIRVKRVHLEEDAGKLIHPDMGAESFVDYNRAGAPLLEIVSEPDLNSPEEAYQYLSDLKLILQYLDVSDCDMEKGTLRCDANISLRPKGQSELGTKAELKNMNSFKAVRAGLEYEIRRQTKKLDDGEKITQETRLWDEKNQETVTMRSKEEAHDYRYFPEPDLPPFEISARQIEDARIALPELPKQRLVRFVQAFGFSQKDASVIISSKDLADFFESCLALYPEPKKIANWLMGPVLAQTDSNYSFSSLQLSPEKLTHLISLVEKGIVSNLAGKTVLETMVKSGKTAEEVIKEKNLAQVSGKDELAGIMEDVISKNKKSVDDYLSGKDNALMFLVGQVMRASKGKANPKVAKELLTDRLKKQ